MTLKKKLKHNKLGLDTNSLVFERRLQFSLPKAKVPYAGYVESKMT